MEAGSSPNLHDGPAADQQLRRALAIADADWTVFVTRPIALTLLVLALLAAVGPLVVRSLVRARRVRD